MLIDNLADPQAPVEEIKTRLDTVETQAPMGYSSVTDGQIRIASPEGLWVEGEGGIKLDGRMDANGVIDVTGTLTVRGVEGAGGVFTAEGTNTLSGTNLLSGPTRVTGTLDIEGATTVTGAFSTSEGGVTLGGPVKITDTLDVTATTTLGGNTTIGGTLEISGATTVKNAFKTEGNTELGGTLSISGATTVNASLTVKQSLKTEGATELGGTVTISGAASLSSTLTVSGSIVSGGVTIQNNRVSVTAGGNTSEMGSTGVVSNNASFGNMRLTNLVDQTGIPSSGRWLMAVGSAGDVVSIPQNVGGPMGDLEWPFDEDRVTDEYGPRESPGGIGSTFHRGMDFGMPEGTPIPACGSGTVVETGTGVVGGSGFGNFVTIEHAGGKRTLYAHMRDAPSYSVGSGIAKGATVGPLGNTGSSTGPHLHLEVHVKQSDGSWLQVNPRDVIKKPWS